MKNITLKVTETAYLRARVWAAGHNTSVSQIVQYMLESLPDNKRVRNAFPEPEQSAPGLRALRKEARKALAGLSLPPGGK